jgi:uncharacterized protein (TIGR02466 family)
MIDNLENITNYFFKTPIYSFENKEYLNELNKISDNYILQAKKNNIGILKEREKNWGKKIYNQKKDHGLSHHFTFPENEKKIKKFKDFVLKVSNKILDNQGFELKNYSLHFSELWVQEFSKLGGGNHSSHIHNNSHISGFYFLKCSDKTSYPIFHDPRPAALISKLPEKNPKNITIANELIHFYPTPGTFVFFNSYLPHEFNVDNGIDDFRFIHFNIQAINNSILNNNLTK